MGSVSTFGSFTVAKLGIWASQKAMQVTGNNITNINTPGYTRQELELKSIYVGGADRYASKWDCKVGSGVMCTGVQQIRSPYLDIRYRTESSKAGMYNTTLDGLNQLSAIFDEIGDGADKDGVMEVALNNLMEKLEYLSSNEGAGLEEYDTIVRGAAEEVVNLFRNYAGQLQTQYNNRVKQFEQDVTTVNSLLKDIQQLNIAIRKAEIHGSNALELKDERNLKIDELSEYISIDVTYEAEDVGAGMLVDKLVIKLDGKDNRPGNNDTTTLVDGKYVTQLDYEGYLDPMAEYDPLTSNFDIIFKELRDQNGKARDMVSGYYTGTPADGEGNPITGALAAGGKLTLGGVTVDVTDAEHGNLTAQLQKLADAYNEQKADDGWKAEVATDNQGNPIIKFTPSAVGDKPADATITTPVAAGAELKYEDLNTNPPISVSITADAADPADTPNQTLLKQLRKLAAEYNKTTDNGWSASVALNDAGEPTGLKFELANKVAVHLDELVAPEGTTLVPDENAVPVPTDVVELTDNDLFGSLQASRELLTEKGEFASDAEVANDPDARVKRGIPFYMEMWNAMAVKFATVLNEANQLPTDADGNITISEDALYKKNADGAFIDADGRALMEDPNNAGQYVLASDGTTPAERVVQDYYRGGVLFSDGGNGDNTEGITAANISISQSWASNKTHVLQCREELDSTQSTVNSNLRHMVSILVDNKYAYKPSDTRPDLDSSTKDVEFFNGTFRGMLTKISSTLAENVRVTTDCLQNSVTNLNDLYMDRESTSGVDLNDEAMAMMQYNKSYSAACRLMTTLDEMLDKLINGTAI